MSIAVWMSFLLKQKKDFCLFTLYFIYYNDIFRILNETDNDTEHYRIFSRKSQGSTTFPVKFLFQYIDINLISHE